MFTMENHLEKRRLPDPFAPVITILAPNGNWKEAFSNISLPSNCLQISFPVIGNG